MPLAIGDNYYPMLQRREAQRLINLKLPPHKVAARLNAIAETNPSLHWPLITRKTTQHWTRGNGTGFTYHVPTTFEYKTGYSGITTPPKNYSADNRHLVFTYGSLKQGYWNNLILQHGGALFWDYGKTIPSYVMYDGPFPKVGDVREIPRTYLADSCRPGRVAGEVYLVNDATLADLDRLEGVPNHYRRDETWIETEAGDVIKAGIYIIQRHERVAMRPDDEGVLDWQPNRKTVAAE